MNKIFEVTQVKKRVHLGFPEGIDAESHRQIPQLLARIDELERALYPFALIGSRVDRDSQELSDCYTKDCIGAFQVMDSNNTFYPDPLGFGIPAE